MKEENIIIRLLRKLGIIKEIKKEESDLMKRELCKAAIDGGVCPKTCETCAWHVD